MANSTQKKDQGGYPIPVKTEAFDDKYWVKQVSEDTFAYEVLYDRYVLKIYRYVFRRVGNQADAEDITSLVFLRALEGILKGQFSFNTPFAAWLFIIARAKVSDYFREREKTIYYVEDACELTDDDAIDASDDMRILANCYSKLSAYEQELLTLRFSSDLDFNTIAVLMHKKTAAIKMATYRSLIKLRKRMEELYEQERT